MEQRIEMLEATVRSLTRSEQLVDQGVEKAAPAIDELLTPSTSDETGQLKIVIDLESSPAVLPGALIRPASIHPRPSKDLVSRGIIDIDQAKTYFEQYKNRLDHFVYRPLGERSLEDVRKDSPLLAAAICTVGALHLAAEGFEACYKEFVALSAAQSFSRNNKTDDVRALCIGAFWLSDLSLQLAGLAVRIAGELQLQKSFFKAVEGSREHYLRTRLFYHVYACDHHFSVAFGRSPMTHAGEAVREVRRFLDCDHATEDDARLVNHVSRWKIWSDIFDTFGADIDRPLSEQQIPQIRQFGVSLEALRAEWGARFSPNTHIGNYPRKGVGLQFHFAKLYLCSHALRGPRTKDWPADVSWELEEIVNSAVLSAVSILRAVVSDVEIQSFLNGLPLYFDIMIAFAVVFLLKAGKLPSALVQLDRNEIRRLINELHGVLERVTAMMHPHHLLVSITKGINRTLYQQAEYTLNPNVPSANPQQQTDSVMLDECCTPGIWDSHFLGDFDFLFPQDVEAAL